MLVPCLIPSSILRTLSYGVPDDTAAKHIELVQPTARFGGPSAQRVGYLESGDFGPATGEPSGSQGSRPLGSAVGAVEAPTAVELCNQTVGIGPQPLVPTRGQPRESGNEPYIELLTYLLALPDSALPQTLSTSYAEEEQSVPREYSLKVCNMFMQLGARGVSVIFASGDTGPGNNCVSNADDATVVLGPTFPAGCPFVTSAGATVGAGPERAAAFSSGGFSIHHARPDSQDPAVRTYLNQTTNVSGGGGGGGGSAYAPFSNAAAGRGIPDVSAQGVNLHVVDGSSVGCRRETAAFGPGGARWNATAGWDPVTGLGTPRFDALLALAAPGVENN
ncbi:hypothetical protein RB594_007011 [Gaeumannomyces avenae]